MSSTIQLLTGPRFQLFSRKDEKSSIEVAIEDMIASEFMILC